MRKLTISIDDTVYDGLHAMLGRGKIGKFLEELARPYVVKDRLGEFYARMAADADREADAREWADEFADDPHDEAW
jgi:hypothetical protein